MALSTAPGLKLVTILCLIGTVAGWYWPQYGDPHSHFYCGRHLQTCENGGECYSHWEHKQGHCYCPSIDGQEYFGYDCGINVTNFPNDDRVYEGCPCHNIPFCYRGEDGITLFCACPPDFFGEDCSKNRVKVECGAQSMDVFFKPIEPFQGIAYFGLESANGNCRLNVSVDEGYEDYKYSRKIGHGEGCNLAESEEWFDGQTTESYTRQLTIQYDPIIESALDLVINVTCHHLDNGTWVTNGSFGTSGRDTYYKGKEVESLYSPVEMTLHGQYNEGEVRDSAYLGERLELRFDLTDNEIYRLLTVDSCTLSNSLGDLEITFVDNGCPTERSLVMNAAGPYHSDDYSMLTFNFRAIRFGSDPVVKLSCRIRLCKSLSSPNCPQNDDCSSSWSGRRKRQATEPEDEGTISKTFTILDPFDNNGQAFKVTSEECLAEPVVKSVGISMAVAVVVMVFVCIGLALGVCRIKLSNRELTLKLRYLQDSPILDLSNFAFQKETGDGSKVKGI